LQRIRSSGLSVVRWGVAWQAVEASPGTYDWTEPDRFFAQVAAVKLKSIVILGLGNRLYDSPPTSAASIAAFAAFAAAAARRYRGAGVTWEIWNEPDLTRFWPPKPDLSAYGRMAAAACVAIKRQDPQAVVIGPASAQIPDPRENAGRNLVAKLQASGAWACFDAVSAHFYHLSRWRPQPKPSEVAPIAAAASRWLSAGAGSRAPRRLLCTEWGYSWFGAPSPDRADDLIKMVVLNGLNGVPLTILYQWRDHAVDPEDPEDHFGLLDSGGRDKGGLARLTGFLRSAGDYRVTERLRLGHPADYVVLLQRPDGARRLLAWSEARGLDTPWISVSGRSALALDATPRLIDLGPGHPDIRLSFRPLSPELRP
jgi:hypothetical protein